MFKQTGQAEEFHDDYAVAAKINGPNNNMVLLFCSFHDTGIVECVKEFTNPVSLKKIIKQVNISDKAPRGSFEILFKVIGVDRNDIKSEIIRINPLDSASVFSN